MIVKIDASFEKDIKKIKDKLILLKLKGIIEFCLDVQQLSQIPNAKKMTGFKNYYRIKLGDFRIGIRIENDEIIFERILHRKEIYRFFP